MLWERRDFETVCRRSLLDDGKVGSLEVLKAFANSLKRRLDAVNANRSAVKVMFPAFIANPDISRCSLLIVIEQLNEELTKFESKLKPKVDEEVPMDVTAPAETMDGAGDSDIRMVYDVTRSVSVPRSYIPTLASHLRTVGERTFMCVLDIGDMFLNFMLLYPTLCTLA